MDEGLDTRPAGMIRTVIASAVLLVFFGIIGYSYWPELLPKLVSGVQSVRSIGADEYASRYFEVQSNSDASDAQVRGVINALEANYLAITEFLGHEPDDRIPVLITNGSGMAMADGERLNIFYDNGVLDLNSAPFFLVFFIEGWNFGAEMNFFLETGYAIYVTEEVGLSQNFTGQSADAWVNLLQEHEALMPLSVAWETQIPENEEAVYDFMRAMIMSGSFVRWLVETYGKDVIYDLRDGLDLTYVINMTYEQAEAAWLASVAAKGTEPRPCRLAAPPGSIFGYLCEQLNETTP